MPQATHPSVSVLPKDKTRIDRHAKRAGKLRYQVVKEALDALERELGSCGKAAASAHQSSPNPA
jgi:hypothetical protein